jgi:parvulin-like peptidyl-prolyl isomerase
MPLIINGKPIDDGAIDAEFASIKSYHERMNNVSCCERDPEFRQTARENVIGRVLLADEALRSVEPASQQEIDAELEKLKEQHGGEGHFYAAMGIGPDQIGLVKQDLDVGIRMNKLLDRLMESEPEPSDAALREFYDKHIATFTTPEERRASHISKGVSRMASRDGLLDEFAAVREKLMNGADFEELAKAHSDRGSDLVDLGYFRRGDLPEEVEIVAFTMRVGEISPVFGSSVGVHIVKLTDIKKAAARPFDQARDDARRLYLEERKRQRAQELIAKLRQEAVIEVVDSELGVEDGVTPGVT